jgi:hypothetical protein
MLAQGLLRLIPLVGDYFSIVIGILMLVLWIVLMIRAYRGEVLRLPMAAELAQRLADVTQTSKGAAPADHETALSSPGTAEKAAAQAASAVAVGKTAGNGEFYPTTRTQRTVSYCFAIFWSFVFLIFLNFYSQYIAVYSVQESGRWFSYPLLAASFSLWLPLINAALVFSIAGNIIMIINDRYIVLETVQITISLMFIAAMAQLLVLFPFNFNIIPQAALAGVMSHVIRILLIIIVIALIISLLVHIVKLIVHAVRGDFN